MRDGNGLTIPGTEGDTWEVDEMNCMVCGKPVGLHDVDYLGGIAHGGCVEAGRHAQDYATEYGTFAFYPDPAHGAWYEIGKGDVVGALYAPMHTDGSMNPQEISEISVTYEEA